MMGAPAARGLAAGRSCSSRCADAAEPFPLQVHAGPDPLGDAGRERRRGPFGRGKRSGAPTRRHTLRGRMRQPRRTCSVPNTATGTTGTPVSRARRPTPRRGSPERPRAHARALGEDHDTVAAREDHAGRLHRARCRRRRDRRGRLRGRSAARLPALFEQLALGHVVDGPAHERADHERVKEAAVVGGEQQRATAR